MTFYQISFTRIGRQDSDAGWQAINPSEGLPEEAFTSFLRFQNGNIYPPVFDAEDSEEQIVTELQTDGVFSFLTHIKYGLKDETGRPSMFANAFVFPTNEFLLNPEDVFDIDSSNFAYDAIKTALPKHDLSTLTQITLKDAVNALGIDSELYLRLVQCVYFTLDSKAKTALHIISDCKEETIRNILFCIFSAMPFEFRKKITYSTYENKNGTQKVLIFDRRNNDSNNLYFNIQSGENNVLNDITQKRWEKYEFMKIVTKNPNIDNSKEFSEIETELTHFGSAQSTSLDLYKIAYDLLLDKRNGTEGLSAEALSKRLNEFLSAPLSHPYLDRQIEIILGQIIENNVELNDILSEKLCRKLEKTQDKDLLETGYIYNFNKIIKLPVHDAAQYLYDSFKNRSSEAFIKIKTLLNKNPNGKMILSCLYTDIIAAELTLDNESILSFYKETSSLSDRHDIKSKLFEICVEYLKSEITSKSDPKLLILEKTALIDEVFSDEPEYVSKLQIFLRKTYWERLSYEDFQLDNPEIYTNMFLKGDTTLSTPKQLFKLFELFMEKERDAFQEELKNVITYNRSLSNKDKTILINKIQKTCIKHKIIYDSSIEFDIWYTLAELEAFEGKSPIKFLLDNHIKGFTTNFERAYRYSAFLKIDKYRETFIEWLKEYVDNKEDDYKIAYDVLHIIKEYDKKIKLDSKNYDRDPQSKSSSDKKSLFNNFGNLFGKNKHNDKK